MDIYSSNWNESDDDNDSAAPDGAPEGMPPSGINNTMRAMMGATKRFVDQYIPKTTDGTGTSTVFTLSYPVAPSALADGMTFLVKFDKTCGDNPTLNVNLLGAKSLYKFDSGSWVAVSAGDIVSGQKLRVTYDNASGNFQILSLLNVVQASDNSVWRTGMTVGFRGSASQIWDGWVLERGNSIGDADSGGTERANADCEDLFKFLWNNEDIDYVLQTSSGSSSTKGSTADDDWTAHKRLVLLDMTDKFRRGGSTAGSTGGADTHTHTLTGTAGGQTSTAIPGTTIFANGGSGAATGFDHAHSISVPVTGTANSTSNVPAYVTELSIIKL